MIYKYYPHNQPYSVSMLKEGYFFFCIPSNSNDPWDTNLTFIKNYPDFYETLQKSPALREYTGEKDFIKTFQEYGICCFSEERDNEHFWSLYANNYSGLCLGFEENACAGNDQDGLFLYFNCQLGVNVIFQPVSYVPEFINLEDIAGYQKDKDDKVEVFTNDELGDKDGFRQPWRSLLSKDKYFESVIRKILTTKKKKIWEIEKEKRLIIPLLGVEAIKSKQSQKFGEIKDENGKFLGYKINWPNDSLREIIFGHKMVDDKVGEIVNIFKNQSDIKFFKTKPSDKEWKIEINPM